MFTVIEEQCYGNKGSLTTKGVSKYMNFFGLWKSLLMVGNKEYKIMNTKQMGTLLTEAYKWKIEKNMKGKGNPSL